MTPREPVQAPACNTARDTGHSTLVTSTRPHLYLRHKKLFIIVALAFTLRLLFALAISGTYDFDEFVILLLSRDYSHGLVPYRDFTFFHPPGVLELYRLLHPLVALWWPLARAVPICIDALTAGLVWRLARALADERTALMAGLLYAISPLALVSAARVEQDSLFTFAGLAGLTLLVTGPSRRRAVAAGVCLTLACWLKLPAVTFAPLYLLAAPRRTPYWILGAALTAVPLLLSVLPEWHHFYFDIVTFQRTRWSMLLDQRVETVLLYWVGVNVLALPGLVRPGPLWLKAGYLVGGLFAFSSQIYYHYFVPVVPFAAILAAPVALRLLPHPRAWLAAGSALAVAWAAVINLGGVSPLYITAAHLSDIAPTIHLLDTRTRPNDPVLADRFEYAYLAGRPAALHYFWNIGVLVDARYLERHFGDTRAVVLSDGPSSGFPRGFLPYLDRHLQRVREPADTVWLRP